MLSFAHFYVTYISKDTKHEVTIIVYEDHYGVCIWCDMLCIFVESASASVSTPESRSRFDVQSETETQPEDRCVATNIFSAQVMSIWINETAPSVFLRSGILGLAHIYGDVDTTNNRSYYTMFDDESLLGHDRGNNHPDYCFAFQLGGHWFTHSGYSVVSFL